MPETPRLRLAAAGDVHCRPAIREQVVAAFAAVEDEVDMILLAGDLTTHGEPEQAEILADACRPLKIPVLTVLGNHDWHSNRRDEVVEILEDAQIQVLDPGHRVIEVRGTEVGVAGVKGFVGGFPGSHLTDFGEPLLRELYAATQHEVDALEAGLRAVATCPFRIVLLHYSPAQQTLEGEPPGIWTFLGSDRLAAPIREHEPDLVLHGHAHAGRFRGEIGNVPVHNVSVPVMGQDFWIHELEPRSAAAAGLH